jgi:hypothetical protein
MRRTGVLSVVAMAMAFSLGCRGPNPDELPQMVGVTGCLTANEDQLVLTRLTPESDAATNTVPPPQQTEMFMLRGMEEDLRPLAGQEVRVRGESLPPDEALVRLPRTPVTSDAAADRAADTSEDVPQVRTVEQTRFTVSELEVRAVTPLNRECQP